jgi:hypothetical protein
MSAPNVVIGTAQSRKGADASFSYTRAAMTTLWWVGLLLVVAGMADVSLALYPFQPGQATWRFAAFSSVANGLPLPAVGLLVATMAALASERRGRARFALFLNAVMLVSVAVLLIGFVSSISAAMQQAVPEVRPGLQKAAFRTILFALSFGAAFLVSSITVFRWTQDYEG